ncbi:DUF3310 domain-containing protein [Acidaminococcus fermentans]
MIKHPEHYIFRGIEAIEAVKILTATATGVEAYLLGCAVKYLYRYPRKNGDQDLAKAEQCIHMLRENLYGKQGEQQIGGEAYVLQRVGEHHPGQASKLQHLDRQGEYAGSPDPGNRRPTPAGSGTQDHEIRL